MVVGHGFLQGDNLCAQESRVVRVLGTILVCLLQLRTLPVIPCGLPDYMSMPHVCRHSIITSGSNKYWRGSRGSQEVVIACAFVVWLVSASWHICGSSTSVEDRFTRVAGLPDGLHDVISLIWAGRRMMYFFWAQ